MMILPHHLCRTFILSTPYLEVSYVRCRPDCSLHQPHVQCVHVLYFIVNIFFVIGLGGGVLEPPEVGDRCCFTTTCPGLVKRGPLATPPACDWPADDD